MIRAYDKVYLDKARTAMGRMLDFAVHELGYALSDFWSEFLRSGVAKRFGEGDFTLLVGKSGVELAYEVVECMHGEQERRSPRYSLDRSAEYWTGWAVAYYQWESGLFFEEITEVVPIEAICEMYSPYHEMDIRQFVDEMNRRYRLVRLDTNLKRMRKAAGLSQRELAEWSGVPLRTLQQYEQRQKNINRARVDYLVVLAQKLGCRVEALLEYVEEK